MRRRGRGRAEGAAHEGLRRRSISAVSRPTPTSRAPGRDRAAAGRPCRDRPLRRRRGASPRREPDLPRLPDRPRPPAATSPRSRSPAFPISAQALRALGLASVTVLKRAIDAQSLMHASDAFIGAGDDEPRGGALLGLITWSAFAGNRPSVDRWLEDRGRLHALTDPAQLADLGAAPRCSRRSRGARRARRADHRGVRRGHGRDRGAAERCRIETQRWVFRRLRCRREATAGSGRARDAGWRWRSPRRSPPPADAQYGPESAGRPFEIDFSETLQRAVPTAAGRSAPAGALPGPASAQGHRRDRRARAAVGPLRPRLRLRADRSRRPQRPPRGARRADDDRRRAALGGGSGAPAGQPPGALRHLAPRPRGVRRFRHAVAVRYSGSFHDPSRPGFLLPEVDLYSAWNEPNASAFLTPQYRDGENVSAAIYTRGY